jgi:uncharacterized membrane protein SpoIIM required for sporulation
VVEGVTDESVWKRIAWLYASFFALLAPVAVVSYLLLPEGVLRGRHPIISALHLSPILWVCVLQITAYNLLFALLVVAANLIARQSRLSPRRFIPTGYLAFWGITVTAALYLGTWSQEVVTPAPPLHQRLLGLFDVLHHAGLIELSAYLLAAATSFKFTLVYTDGKKVVASRGWRHVELTPCERVLLLLAFLFIVSGAIVESYAIAQLRA